MLRDMVAEGHVPSSPASPASTLIPTVCGALFYAYFWDRIPDLGASGSLVGRLYGFGTTRAVPLMS